MFYNKPIKNNFTEPIKPNVCYPSPCGPNSQCNDVNGQSICACLRGYYGNPPACRPECVVSSDCSLERSCLNQKCIDPCPGTCGLYAECKVINHNPVCSCLPRYTGDPLNHCTPIGKKN